MKRASLLITGLITMTFSLFSQNNIIPIIQLMEFTTGLTDPVDIENAGDPRLFVVEKAGRIKILDVNGNTNSFFLNIEHKVLADGFEQGLLGVAFDPNYATNGYFYVHYTNLDGNNQISRFSVNPHNPSKAMPNSELVLLVDDDPYENHNGGQLKFGPDGYLYIGIGDGGSAGDPLNNAQNVATVEGKLLRIDPTTGGYDIPADNPYVGVAGAVEEIWATGLRNPWRFSFDRLTGDLWIGDVGQDQWEEIDFQLSTSAGGENYGWSCMEGTHFYKADCDNNGVPFTDPIAEYRHDEDTSYVCSGSVTGGYVYRGSTYPNMYGKYIYTDFCTGIIRTTYWDGTAWVTAIIGQYEPFAYSSFGEDINGELYLADKTNGIIYKIIDASSALALPEDDGNANEGEEVAAITKDYLLSPNPTNGDFKLTFNSEWKDISKVQITDMTGRPVWQGEREIVKGFNAWNFNQLNLSPGYYILQVEDSYGQKTIHFVAE